MIGKSPENKTKEPVTVDRIVTIGRFDGYGEHVKLDFSSFKEEEIVRKAYLEYVAAIQSGYQSLVQQPEMAFFTLTHIGAAEVYEKVQEMEHLLDQKKMKAAR